MFGLTLLRSPHNTPSERVSWLSSLESPVTCSSLGDPTTWAGIYLQDLRHTAKAQTATATAITQNICKRRRSERERMFSLQKKGSLDFETIAAQFTHAPRGTCCSFKHSMLSRSQCRPDPSDRSTSSSQRSLHAVFAPCGRCASAPSRFGSSYAMRQAYRS